MKLSRLLNILISLALLAATLVIPTNSQAVNLDSELRNCLNQKFGVAVTKKIAAAKKLTTKQKTQINSCKSKKVSAVTPTPTPTPSPTSSPAPTPSPTPTPTPTPSTSKSPAPASSRDPKLPNEFDSCLPNSDDSFGYKRDGSLVYLICSSNGTGSFWISTPGTANAFRSIPGSRLPILGPDPREEVLFRAFKNVLEGKKPGNLSFDFYVDPKFSSKYEDLIRTGSLEFSKVFGGYFTKRTNFYVVMVNDRAYGERIFAEFAAKGIFSKNLMDNQTSNLIRYIDQRTNPQTSSAYATHENTQNALLVYISNPELNIDLWKIGGVFHETYHQLQFDLLPNQTQVLPCWIVEGQPNLIALSLGFDLYGPEITYSLLRRMNSNSRTSDPDVSRLEGVANRIYGTYCGNIGEYEQGAIANAYLIAKYGFDKAIKIYESARSARPNTDDWTVQFKNIIGITPEDFYAEVKIYIEWFFDKYLK